MEYLEARAMLLGRVSPVAAEPLPLERAYGRVLAETVTAACDVPPFARSPYDGYAFRAADTAAASREHPVTLKILEEIPAGAPWTKPVTPGTASKILTGAPVPEGADAVTKFEDTAFTAETVTLFAPFRAGENVCPRGEDVTAGQVLARPGTVIDGALAGTLAAQGVLRPRVYRRPKVAILTTGSELVSAEEGASGAKIVNTNRYTLEAALRELGTKPVFCGSPGDTEEAIAAAMEQALLDCDLVVTTGGVSVGDYDKTPAALERIGAELLARRINLKPGGACCYGVRDGKLLCCLSGNPASAMTNFYGVVLPSVLRLTGRDGGMTETTVRLAAPFQKKSSCTRLVRGRLTLDGGEAAFWPAGGQGNGVLHTLIGCNALAEVPAGSGPLEAGTRLRAWIWGRL